MPIPARVPFPPAVSNLPMVVGRVKPTPSKIERFTNPDYPRPYSITLEENSGRSRQFLEVTLCAQFNKTPKEAQYIISRVQKGGCAVVETYPNKEVAESKLDRVNDCLAILRLPPLEMDIARL